MTPLGQGEEQNRRIIAVTMYNPSVSIGRASKNPNKGLLAAPDNAWFDYPILSRTHAKFTASRAQQVSHQRPSKKGVTLISYCSCSTYKTADQLMAPT